MNKEIKCHCGKDIEMDFNKDTPSYRWNEKSYYSIICFYCGQDFLIPKAKAIIIKKLKTMATDKKSISKKPVAEKDDCKDLVVNLLTSSDKRLEMVDDSLTLLKSDLVQTIKHPVTGTVSTPEKKQPVVESTTVPEIEAPIPLEVGIS